MNWCFRSPSQRNGLTQVTLYRIRKGVTAPAKFNYLRRRQAQVEHSLLCGWRAGYVATFCSLDNSKTKAHTYTKLGTRVYGGWDKEHLIPNTDRCVHRGRNSTHICGPSVLLIDQKQKHLIASNSIDGRMVRGAMAVFEHRPDAFIGGAAAPNLWPLMFP